MGRKTKSAVVALSVVMVVLGGQAVRASNTPQRPDSPKAALQQASVTVPELEKPLVVQAALSSNTRGWTRGSGAVPGAEQGIRPELVDAYNLAVALAPPECHLSLSLLAAIGQVESGNLAGQRIDAQHRVVPGVLGPVLDGSTYAAVPDTDDGRWDGNKTWDRALGPLQLIPASWRVAGMDADGDGRRDPQNVYDAAGAAMVYLCDGGRDLGSRDGLEQAVLAYNHSQDYLRLVLAWKTAFDTADVAGLGSLPPMGAWAASTLVAPTPTRATGGSNTETPATAADSSGPETTATSVRPPKVTPAARTADDATDRPDAVPTASDSPDPAAKPSPKPGDKPTPGKPGGKPKPGDKPEPGEDPTCLPSDEVTPTEDPSASPTCCPTPDSSEPSETPTATPSEDPSADSTELPDPCATETTTPTAEPTP